MYPICDRFKQIRKEAGLTQPKFAEVLGITRSAVNAIENHRYIPNINIIRSLHKDFKRSYEWIIDGKR